MSKFVDTSVLYNQIITVLKQNKAKTEVRKMASLFQLCTAVTFWYVLKGHILPRFAYRVLAAINRYLSAL